MAKTVIKLLEYPIPLNDWGEETEVGFEVECPNEANERGKGQIFMFEIVRSFETLTGKRYTAEIINYV